MDTRLIGVGASEWDLRDTLFRIRYLIRCQGDTSGKWAGLGIAVIKGELQSSLERGVA